MESGRIMQGGKPVAFKNIAILRGVIAGDILDDFALVPGDAKLELLGKEFDGSVIEIREGEAVFSTPQLAEVAELLGGPAEDLEPVPKVGNQGR